MSNTKKVIDLITSNYIDAITKYIAQSNIKDKDEIENIITEINEGVNDEMANFINNIHNDYTTGDDEVYNYYFGEE